jgi:hypothetical protein
MKTWLKLILTWFLYGILFALFLILISKCGEGAIAVFKDAIAAFSEGCAPKKVREARAATRPAPARPAPTGCDSPGMRSSLEKVWAAWDGDISEMPRTPEVMAASILGLLLNPYAPDEMFDAALDGFKEKGGNYLPEETLDEINDALKSRDADRRIEAVRKLIEADAKALALMRCVMADTEKTRRFILKQKLEDHDGHAP